VKFVLRVSVYNKSNLPLVGKRHVCRQRDGRNSRQRSKPRLDNALRGVALVGRSIALPIERRTDNQRAFRIEPERNLKYTNPAPQQQTRSDEQDHGAANLGHDQEAAHTPGTAAASHLPRRLSGALQCPSRCHSANETGRTC
jgi:hypothetical protein